MSRILKLGAIVFMLLFTANSNAWAWMTGAQASAAASSGGFSTGSFSCGGSSSSSSSSYSGSYSSGTSAVMSASPSSSSSAYTTSSSGWLPVSFLSSTSTGSSYTGSGITTSSVFSTSGVSSVTSNAATLGATATGATTYSGISGTGTNGFLQLSGTTGKEIASEVRSDLTSSAFMQQGAFANSALINSDGITAQASRANFFANEATKPTISADEYHSDTAAAYIPASTDSKGVVVCSGASGENLAQGIVRPNTSTDGGVSLAHESDFTTSSFTTNSFFTNYYSLRGEGYTSTASTATTNSQTTAQATQDTAYYDIPTTITNDPTYTNTTPVLAGYNPISGQWGNPLDDGPTTNTYGLLTDKVIDPLKATVTPDQE